MKTAEATAATTTVLSPGFKRSPKSNGKVNGTAAKKTGVNHGNGGYISNGKVSFMKWTLDDVVYVAKYHRLPCFFAAWFLFFIYVEYTLRMVFVAMQSVYIIGTWVVEGRPRATISALFMFTCRGILGYTTQLPLPQEFVGSGMDFPVGNVSFFLFYSGHVAGSVIASLDMRRMQRWELAWLFDILNVLQAVRLLGTRGHYTIDLAVGVGAGILFDSLAGKYIESRRKTCSWLEVYHECRLKA
ncbi:hypothetical protein GOBAR_DD11705 [Gossypium barbadense]|nr:hypothetical protein GOBAR_DD11705 [Gossypium barbadense]